MSTTFPESLTAFRDSFADLNDAEIADLAKVSIEETAAYRAFLAAEQATAEQPPKVEVPPADQAKKSGGKAKPKVDKSAAMKPAVPEPVAAEQATAEQPPKVEAPARVRVTVRRLYVQFHGQPNALRRYDEFGGEFAMWLWANHRSAVEAV